MSKIDVKALDNTDKRVQNKNSTFHILRSSIMFAINLVPYGIPFTCLARQLWVWGAFSKRKMDGVWFDVRPYVVLPFYCHIAVRMNCFCRYVSGNFTTYNCCSACRWRVSGGSFSPNPRLMMRSYPIEAKRLRHTMLRIVIYAILCCLKVQAQSEYVIPHSPNQWCL